MAFGIDSVKRELENALFVDDESRTDDAVFFDTIDLFRLPHTVLLARRAFRIRKKPHRDSVLVTKLGVLDALIAADADDRAGVPRKLVFVIGKMSS